MWWLLLLSVICPVGWGFLINVFGGVIFFLDTDTDYYVRLTYQFYSFMCHFNSAFIFLFIQLGLLCLLSKSFYLDFQITRSCNLNLNFTEKMNYCVKNLCVDDIHIYFSTCNGVLLLIFVWSCVNYYVAIYKVLLKWNFRIH